ncbi:hypothetical protein [Pseudomonas sp. zfem003]|uniref:hypothetical protein n=1 Tax=Pseudomonas sp. zfem003 TaxID=3078198 RepID=UPI0029279DBB|nr:hypothetical protein [Pseudomonas sp. zfem003]MDU9398086.1 hypothetical protein [Pseudomonas sp. zfem003]
MDDNLIERRRKAFELRFLVPDGVAYNAENNTYIAEHTDSPAIYVGRVGQASFCRYGWKIWNAALDSAVVELPDVKEAKDIAYFNADVVDAIERAGLRVKS